MYTYETKGQEKGVAAEAEDSEVQNLVTKAWL